MDYASKIFGRLGYEAALRKGNESEQRVLDAFEHARVQTPEWFRRIDRASRELDLHEGVDYVIESDVGNLFLQVKSSDFMADRFRYKQWRGKYNRYIGVVSLEGLVTYEDICKRVFKILKKVRKKILRMRNSQGCP